MGGIGAGIAVSAWMVVLSCYDIRQRRLPNALTLTGAVVILAIAVVAGRRGPAALGALGLLAPYLAVHLVAPRAMGAGDVKLAIGVGALTGAYGFDVWALAAFVAPVLTAVAATVALICRRASTVPHGPAMCLASAAGVVLAISV